VKTPDDGRKELPWLTDNSIPAANPNDLRILWKLQKDLEARYGRQGVIMLDWTGPAGCFEFGGKLRRCVLPIIVATTLTRILSEAGHLNFPWIHDGEPEDAVFKALATVPMAGSDPG
jgi:hypothetical protein